MSDHLLDPSIESARILAAIVESSNDAIIGKDLEGIVVSWNRAAERLYGYTAEEMKGRSIALLVPDTRADELPRIIAQIRSGERIAQFETIRRTKTGAVVEVSLTVSPICDANGRVVGAASIARDITARKRDERTLRSSEQRWRAIIESAVDGIVVIDAGGRIECFNPAAERLFGYSEAAVLGRNVSMLMPSPYHEEHDGYLARYLATGEKRIIGIGREVTGRRRDGSVFPMHLSVGELQVEGERKFTGIVHDLTKRVELAHLLGTADARWRSIIDSAVDAIVVIDARGRIESFNPAAVRFFGYSEAEVLGQNVSLLMPSPDREQHDGYLERYLTTGVSHIIGIGREVTALRKDGTTAPVSLSVGEMAIDGERKFTGILHDLSSRVRIEEQLREQTAMARLGEMAAVVAHEIKNPLAGIRGAIQVIGGRMAQDSREAAVMQEIVTRIDGLNELVKDLLVFARPPQPKPVLVDMAGLIRNTVEFLSPDPAMGAVRVELQGEAPAVIADPELLKIVFVNFMLNAAQAMGGQGLLRVTMANPDGICEVVFQDSGPGIPPEIRTKVFTPFFTTKSRGTGLGLPTAKRLIEAHAGTVRLDCPPEGGTVITIRLPTRLEAAQPPF